MLSTKNNNNNLFKKIYEISKEIFFTLKQLKNFNEEFIYQLNINSKEEKFCLNISPSSDSKSLIFSGYPTGNYLKIISRIFEIWSINGAINIIFSEIKGINDNSNSELEVVMEKIEKHILALNIISLTDNSSFIKTLSLIYDLLEVKGFLLLLGMRLSIKCVYELPPKRERLVSEFNRKFSEKSKLTAGARAVAKHSDRNKKNKFWIQVKGTEEERNIESNKICLDIIANSTWISLFNLNKTCKILEIRNKDGYGLRWDLLNERILFKGLVEPQLLQHNIKKRHSDSE